MKYGSMCLFLIHIYIDLEVEQQQYSAHKNMNYNTISCVKNSR